MVEETRGRPSKAETRAGNIVQRVQAIEHAAGRPLPYAQRLYHERRLTLSQLAATAQIARLYRQWAKQNGSRFNAKSQSFEFTTAGEVDRILSAEDQERINDVNEAWHRLEKCVPVTPREAWAWVFELCVMEAYVPLGVLFDIKVVLDRVADEFGLVDEVEEAVSATARQNSKYQRRRPVFPRRDAPAVPSPSIVPALKPTRPRPRPRSERFDKGEYAAAPKHPKPSQLTEKQAVAAARDREGLERTLRARQAQNEATS